MKVLIADMFFKVFYPKDSFFLIVRQEVILLFRGSQFLLQRALPDGEKEILEIFQSLPSKPYRIFFDTADEIFHTETIPTSLTIFDIYRWIRQKERVLFPSSMSYRGHVRVSAQEILFIGLSEVSSQWVTKIIKAIGNPFRGIYVLSFEEAYLWRQLHKALSSEPAAWLFVLTLEPVTGRIRHTILFQGNFFLTRLLPALPSSFLQDEIASSEMNATLRYLLKKSSHKIEKMDFLCLGYLPAGPWQAVVQRGQEWGISIPKAALLLGMNTQREDWLPVIFEYAQKHRPFPLVKLKHDHHNWLPRYQNLKNLKIFSEKEGWAVCIILLLMGSFFHYRSSVCAQVMYLKQDEKSSLSLTEQTLSQKVSAFPISADRLKRVLNFVREGYSIARSPLESLGKLESILPEKMRLAHLDWVGNQDGASLNFRAYSFETFHNRQGAILFFDQFLTKLAKEFDEDNITVLYAPYSTHPKQKYQGQFGEPEVLQSPSITIKISWPLCGKK